jgi:hypothetical protein
MTKDVEKSKGMPENNMQKIKQNNKDLQEKLTTVDSNVDIDQYMQDVLYTFETY